MSSVAYKWGGEVSIFLELSIVVLTPRTYLIHVSSCTFLAENVLAMRRLSSAFS